MSHIFSALTWCKVSPIINILNQRMDYMDSPTVHSLHQGSLLVLCWFEQRCCCSSVAQSCPTLHDPMDCSKHSRPPCPSPSPEVFPSSGPLHWWCHPTNSSSGALFSFCPQSFPVLGAFPISQLFTSGDQIIRASASVLPINIQGWFPLGLTGLIFLQSKGLWGVFSSTTIQKHQFFDAQPFLRSNSHICTHDYWKNHSFDLMDLCWQNDVPAFNTLSRFGIAFHPRNKHLLISWL